MVIIDSVPIPSPLKRTRVRKIAFLTPEFPHAKVAHAAGIGTSIKNGDIFNCSYSFCR